VEDLNFLTLCKYFTIITWAENALFDQISACRIVYVYMIFIAVTTFCESFTNYFNDRNLMITGKTFTAMILFS